MQLFMFSDDSNLINSLSAWVSCELVVVHACPWQRMCGKKMCVTLLVRACLKSTHCRSSVKWNVLQINCLPMYSPKLLRPFYCSLSCCHLGITRLANKNVCLMHTNVTLVSTLRTTLRTKNEDRRLLLFKEGTV
jgi:hypothetical protein